MDCLRLKLIFIFCEAIITKILEEKRLYFLVKNYITGFSCHLKPSYVMSKRKNLFVHFWYTAKRIFARSWNFRRRANNTL